MRFGVNYTPRRGWFHAWLDFDPDEAREDLAAIAALGADHVRIFPLWPLLQPNRTLIRGIDDVVALATIATEVGLDVSVDVLQGHLSSFDFLPSWVQTWHRRNLFTDLEVVSGQRALVRALAEALCEVPEASGRRVTGLCVGNEFLQFAAHRHPDAAELTPDQAGRWLSTLLGAAQEAWPQGRHVHCFDDDLWFDDTHPFLPRHAVEFGSQTTVHSWIFGSVGQRFGVDAPESAWFARWLCELAAGWGAPGREIWLQEIGAPLSHLSADAAPAFLTETIGILMGERGGGRTPGLSAITWWCSHDVSRELADFPELEHTLGLFAADGTRKPVGDAFATAVQRWSAQEVPEESGRAPIEVALRDDLGDRSRTSAHGAVFDQWYAAARMGDVRAVRPVVG